MKNKKGFIPTLFLITLIIITFVSCVPTINAGTVFTVEDWEDYNVGVSSGTSTYMSFETSVASGIHAKVSNTWAYSGTKSLYFDDYGFENCNLSLIYSYEAISIITIYTRFKINDAPPNGGYINFKMYNSTNDCVIEFGAERDTGEGFGFYWVDSEANKNYFGSEWVLDGVWSERKIVLTHLNSNEFNISIYSHTDTFLCGYADSTCISNDYTTFRSIYLNQVHSSSQLEWFIDDIIFDTSTVITEETANMCEDYLNNFKYYQEIDTFGHYYSVSGWALENKLGFPLNGYIYGVDLHVSADQYRQVSPYKEDYSLSISGFNVGNPNFYYRWEYGYMMRWCQFGSVEYYDDPLFEFVVDASSETVTPGFPSTWEFTWESMGYTGFPGNYWYPSTQPGGEFLHNRDTNIHDGVYNGELFHGITYTEGLGMGVYYALTDAPLCGGTDSIFTVPKSQSDYPQYKNIIIDYNVSTSSPSAYCQLWNLDTNTQYLNDGFGKQNSGLGYYLNGCDGVINFLPKREHYGNWGIVLVRSGVNISYDNFTISNLSEPIDYYAQIWTTPQFTNPYESFKVGWLYNKTYYSNQYGAVLYTTTSEYTKPKSAFFMIQGDNENGDTHPGLSSPGDYYFWLCSLVNGTYKPITSPALHVIGSLEGNALITAKKHYTPECIDVPLTWSHNHPFSDIRIYVDNGLEVIFNIKVSDTQGTTHATICEFGMYTGELRRYFAEDDYELLAFVDFAVLYEPGIPKPSDLFPELGQPLGSFVGMIITICCLMIPFVFAKGLHIKQHIHPVIYVLTGGMGIGISVVIGLFPAWLPFFVIGGGIITIFLTYLIKIKGGGGD